jgi:hypothetical protein
MGSARRVRPKFVSRIPRQPRGRSVGAGRGSRTPKTRRSADFESAASASSAIPAREAGYKKYKQVSTFLCDRFAPPTGIEP